MKKRFLIPILIFAGLSVFNSCKYEDDFMIIPIENDTHWLFGTWHGKEWRINENEDWNNLNTGDFFMIFNSNKTFSLIDFDENIYNGRYLEQGSSISLMSFDTDFEEIHLILEHISEDEKEMEISLIDYNHEVPKNVYLKLQSERVQN